MSALDELNALTVAAERPSSALDELNALNGTRQSSALEELNALSGSQDTGSVIGDIGRAFYDVPVQLKAATAAALEGSDPFGSKNSLDEWAAAGEERQRERNLQPGGEESLLGISRQNIRNLPSNAAFSGVSMAAGLAAGLPTAILNPAAGWAAGGAASGVAAYRMDANKFLRQVRSAMDEVAGRPVTDEEWASKEPAILDAAKRHAMFEAIPEAIGNVAGLKIITAPLKGILGKNIATRVAGKLAGLYGTELATEATTQMGQHNVEREIGLTPEPARSWTSGEDWMKSLKEVAPDTFLLTTIFGLGGMAGHKAYQSIRGTKSEADYFKSAVSEGKLAMIPDSEFTQIVEEAKLVELEHPEDEELGQAVLAMKQDLIRREQAKPEETGTMQPQPEPVMEPGVESQLNMEPGSQYKGMVSDQESILRSEQAMKEQVDTTFTGKDAVVRRDKIIKNLSKAIGYPVYQGRIRKGKRELGFYKPRTDEVRLKNKNDIEVAAHEIAHLLDYTEKTFRQGYHQKEFKKEVRSLSYDKTKLTEGFAEFVRHWMTDTDYVLKKAPKFTAWFEKTLTGHKHEQAIRTAQKEMHAWFNQGMENRFRSKTGKTPETLRESVKRHTDKLFDRTLAATFDAFHGIKLMNQDLLGKDARALPAYMAVRLLAGNRMLTRAVFEHGTPNFRPNGDIYFTGKGLDDVFSGIASDMKGGMEYYAARRAHELMGQGREHNYTREEIKAILDRGDNPSNPNYNPEYRKSFEKWIAFNQRMLDFLETAGVISPETRANFDRMNREYVPFRRVIESITGEQITTSRDTRSFLRRLTGGTGNVNDILENITTNVQLMVESAMANRAKQDIYNLVGTKKGGAKYAVKVAPDIKVARVDTAQMLQAMRELKIPVTPEQVAKMEDYMTFFTYGHPPKGTNIDVVFYKGKPTYFEVAPGADLFLRAIHAFGTKNYGLAIRIAGGFKNTLTRLVTLAPEFMLVNGIRDTVHSFLTSKFGFKPALDSVRGFKSRMTEDAAYWEAMANGMGMASMIHGETARYQHRLERIYAKNGWDRDSILDAPAKLVDWWEDIVSYTEYSARVQEFKLARKAGVSAREAAFAGRELSTDFAMRGSSDFVRIFTMTVPFLGAHLQSLYRGARALAPGTMHATGEGESFGRLAVKGLVGITTPTILLYLLNRDDDRYKGLRDWERMLHWVILPDDKKKAFLIPKPFDFGALFASIPEILTERFIREVEGSNKGDGEKFRKSLLWILANQFGINATPQIIRPGLDVLRNKQWTGGPVVTEDLKNVAAFEQYTPWTSKSLVWLGRQVDMSPVKLEHLFRGYFGTIGGYVLMASDNLVAHYNGNLPAEKRLDETILLRRFAREYPLRHTQQQDDVYEMSREITEILTTFNKIKKDMRADDALTYLSEPKAQNLYALSETSKTVKDAASLIRSQIKMIQSQPGLTPLEKRQQIDAMLRLQSDMFKQTAQQMEAVVNR